MYNISTIQQVVNGQIYGVNIERNINRLVIDSRGLSGDSQTLFIALKSERNDGHRYIENVYYKGIRCFLVSKTIEIQPFPDATFILVKNTTKALQQLAAYHRQQFTIPIIGITGSNGKTIVKEWLNYLISPEINSCKSPKSYNSQIGVPLSVWQLDKTSKIGCFEAGISEPYEMEKLEEIIQPTIGIMTNLGDAHQEGFSSVSEKLSEKMKLFRKSHILLYRNESESTIDQYLQHQKPENCRLLSWGTGADNDIQLSLTEKNKVGVTLHLQIHNQDFLPYFSQNRISLELPFADAASIENCMHALLAVSYLSTLHLSDNFPTIVTVAERIRQLYAVNLRLEIIEGKFGSILLNDCYSNDIQGFSIALQQLTSSAGERDKTVILSEFTHSGLSANLWLQKLKEELQHAKVSLFIGIGKSFMETEITFHCPTQFYETTGDFLSNTATLNYKNSAILLKGERNFQFEKILPLFTRHTHLTTLEVNLTKALNNLNIYREQLKPSTQICVLLKANAYGMGMVEMAKFLELQHIHYIGVAIADEGILLREHGITTPIIVLNPEPDTFSQMMTYRLEPEIYSLRLLKAMLKAALHAGELHYPIHLKIDTGMHRLGFSPEDIQTLTELLQNRQEVSVRSIFSHFASADEPKNLNFAQQQLMLFSRLTEELRKTVATDAKLHIANSAAIFSLPQSHFDMVRLGIGFYGYAQGVKGLEGIATLKSTIIQLRKVKPGDSIGYGYSRESRISQHALIAVVPIGYADGLDRRLGNRKSYFIVNGLKAKIVGRICMDLCMIDVTNIDVAEGDEVIVFGDNPTVHQLAQKLDTIPYEILTSVSDRVKRVYYLQ